MNKLTNLTAAQKARMAPYAQERIRHLLRVAPTDRELAERGIRASYDIAGLSQPKRIIWVSSPIAGMIAFSAAMRVLESDKIGAFIDAFKYAVGDAVDDRNHNAVGNDVGDMVCHAVGSAVIDAVGEVRDSVRHVVGGIAGSAVRRAVGNVVIDAVSGSVGDTVNSAVADAARSAIFGTVHEAIEDAVYSVVGYRVRNAVRDGVGYSVGRAVDGEVGHMVGIAVNSAVDAAVRDTIYSAVYHTFTDAVYAAVSLVVGGEVYSVDNAVFHAVGNTINDTVNSAVYDAVRDSVRWWRPLGEGLWGWRSSWAGFFRDECGLDLGPALEALEQTTECGWWWPHSDFVIACDRHTAIHRDEEGRLHCEDGAAISWGDGWGIHAWHGTRVPAEWIENPDPEKLAPLTLTWENIEQRRALSEILGWEAVLTQLQPRTIDKHPSDLIGELVEVELPDVGRTRFIRVTCGTGRKFALVAPKHLDSAMDVQRWMYPGLPDGLDFTQALRT